MYKIITNNKYKDIISKNTINLVLRALKIKFIKFKFSFR